MAKKDKDKDPPPRPKRHAHNWVWKRRANPIDGSRPFDEYRCEGPDGCGSLDQRPV